MAARKQTGAQGISDQFKRFVLVLTISFACYRLFFALVAPEALHIPDELLLSVMLLLIAYLWSVQTRTLNRLHISETKLQEAQVGILAALVAAVEAKDPYTRGHSEHVQRLAVELAERLKLDEEHVQVVSRAAVLHDIGKIETPDAILRKNLPLSDEEWQVLKKHPARTASILSSLDFLGDEIRAAVFHHERVDGAGYGVGLKGPSIPLESSIIAVADTFDAMNSDRPYRKRLPRATILEELRLSRGVQHPETVVDAFIEMISERPEMWVRAEGGPTADGATEGDAAA